MAKKKIIFWGMGNIAKKFVSQYDGFMREVLGLRIMTKTEKRHGGIAYLVQVRY